MFKALYIHIPFCVSKCEYCDFFSVACGKSGIREGYVQALCNELNFRLTNNEKLESVYIGGGTPSLLSSAELLKIFSELKPFVSNQTEISIELNPDDITEQLLFLLGECGVTRLSIGIQSMDSESLSSVKRRASLKQNYAALELVKKIWKGELSLDLISALPGQSKEDFMQGLEVVVSYNPDHLSLYSLTIEEETPLGKKLLNGTLDYDFDAADELWLKGKDFLSEKGYVQYEVSNFYNKNKGKPCKHNTFYWKLLSYAGCGSGATGTFYSEEAFRYTNTKNIQKYIDFWSSKSINEDLIPAEVENLSSETLIFEYFMMGLRMKDGVSLTDFKNRFCREVPEKFHNAMEKWILLKKAFYYTKENQKYFTLTEEGFLFLNQFLQELF